MHVCIGPATVKALTPFPFPREFVSRAHFQISFVGRGEEDCVCVCVCVREWRGGKKNEEDAVVLFSRLRRRRFGVDVALLKNRVVERKKKKVGTTFEFPTYESVLRRSDVFSA